MKTKEIYERPLEDVDMIRLNSISSFAMKQQWEGGNENYSRNTRKTRFFVNVVIECLIVDGRRVKALILACLARKSL